MSTLNAPIPYGTQTVTFFKIGDVFDAQQAALIQIFDMRAGFFEGEQNVVAFHFVE